MAAQQKQSIFAGSMSFFSIVIICRDAGHVIGETLRSVQGLSDDILLYDNGSTDDTLAIASTFTVRIEKGTWEGYGGTKNKANALAKHDWILNLDADESADERLKSFLQQWEPEQEHIVYKVKRRNFLGNMEVRFGVWGRDHIIRMFNRKLVKWNDAAVHEIPEMPTGTVIHEMDGAILHRTMKDETEYAEKTEKYAALSAAQYMRTGKHPSLIKEYLSPVFSFFRNYILRLGFLDGKAGFTCAKMTSRYTRLKYSGLRSLYNANRRR